MGNLLAVHIPIPIPSVMFNTLNGGIGSATSDQPIEVSLGYWTLHRQPEKRSDAWNEFDKKLEELRRDRVTFNEEIRTNPVFARRVQAVRQIQELQFLDQVVPHGEQPNHTHIRAILELADQRRRQRRAELAEAAVQAAAQAAASAQAAAQAASEAAASEAAAQAASQATEDATRAQQPSTSHADQPSTSRQ